MNKLETLQEIAEALLHYIRQVFSSGALFRVLGAFLASLFTFFFGDITTAVYAFLGLLILDIVTGTWASAETGKEITSKMFLRGAVKIIIYFILICTGHLLETIGLPLTRSAAIYYAALTEGRSILENLELISGGLPLIDYIQELLKKEENNK